MTSLKDTMWIFYIAYGIEWRVGEVDSITKLEKIIFFCSRKLRERAETLQSIEFERGFFGPRDPGASYDLETNLMLGIFVKTQDETRVGFRFSDFGKRFVEGLKSILSLDSDFETTKAEIDGELDFSAKRSLSDILLDKRVIEAKKKFLKEKID